MAAISLSDQIFCCEGSTLVVLVETISAAEPLVGLLEDDLVLGRSIPKSFLNKSKAREAKSASEAFLYIQS
jgi:hypothetical protein